MSSVSNVTSSGQTSREERMKSKYNSMNGGMNIDTKQLYDPDSLWRRNKCRYCN